MRIFILFSMLMCLFFVDNLAAERSNYNPHANTDNAEIDFHISRPYKIQVSEMDINDELARINGQGVKDSLRILLLKLMNLDQLNQENLLAQDIQANHSYYVELLEVFQSSEIDEKAYSYLQAECLKISLNKMRFRYRIAMSVSAILLLLLLINFYYKRQDNSTNDIVALTSQELIIKELIQKGKSNKEIAEELFISLSTVKTHTSNLYKKLGVNGRRELINSQG